MRSIVILAAAATVLGGISVSAPALANPGAVCNPWVHQSECAFEFQYKSGSAQSESQTQVINGHKGMNLWGLIQSQFALNASVKAGGDQSITQSQTLNLGHHDDAKTFFAPVQNQVAVNVQYKANVDQSISQTQTISSHDDVYGPQQDQTAVNIAVESHGSQSITQSQGININ